jgi:hypothetical protein
MALLEKEQQRMLLGIGIGVAATLVARAILPPFHAVGRPLAKAALKSSVIAYERTREKLAEWTEDVEDMLAEVRSEMAQESTNKAAPAESFPEPVPEGKSNGGA